MFREDLYGSMERYIWDASENLVFFFAIRTKLKPHIIGENDEAVEFLFVLHRDHWFLLFGEREMWSIILGMRGYAIDASVACAKYATYRQRNCARTWTDCRTEDVYLNSVHDNSGTTWINPGTRTCRMRFSNERNRASHDRYRRTGSEQVRFRPLRYLRI